MFLLILLSQVIASPTPTRRPVLADCRMSAASCERLRQLKEEDNEYIGLDNIVPQDYEPLYSSELYRLRTYDWGTFPTEQRKP